ncbi:hypothetical protein B0T20DRAFT_410367 [Sordaria brevicollis]|uniref:Uncharacterized protein n=1 Tax=Sordaria brevicollis TaxID=83679 RepID=A0AAE0UBM5_SORBR|nr:hypothetical protein B0T20DRAFT_410367 [Sordaria brevicollis]
MHVSFLYLAAMAVPAMSVLVALPPHKKVITEENQNWKTVDGETTCPYHMEPSCCDSLDYSGFQVECIGPGKVEYLEKCLDYEPRPMCCCVYELRPDMPQIPRQISCDKDCASLGKEPEDEEAKNKVAGDL